MPGPLLFPAVVSPAVLSLLDFANKWIEKGGVFVLGAIVFAESGLLVGFFLPGDSLLFFAGFLTSAAGGHKLPAMPIVAGVAAVAAIIGDQVGYLIGRELGPALFHKQKSRFFNPQNVEKAHAFFERHGSKTIVLARFVPIVRTFVPTVAGVSHMHYRTFVTYNVIGGMLWGAGIVALGHYLGEVEFIKNNIEVAAIIIVLVSVLPVIIELIRHRRAAQKITADLTDGDPAT